MERPVGSSVEDLAGRFVFVGLEDTIANIRHELGRHKWIEGYREVRALKDSKREVLKCGNCSKIWYEAQGDPPVVGCISDIDLRKLGPSRQKDQLECDLRGNLYRGGV